jgi:ATP-dependent Clp protease ATP-binding subunit ClpC
MGTFRFPVLLFRDALGQSTAIAIGSDEQSVAVADSDSKAFEQLSDYLHWQAKRAQWLSSPDLIDPTVTTVRVPIRPEYRTRSRSYPCAESFPLKVICVHGRQERGVFFAELPLLGSSFYYYDERTLPDLIQRSAQEQLKGLTPRDLAAYLPPDQVELRTLVVRLPTVRRMKTVDIQAKNLPLVADALGDRHLRQQFRQAWEREKETTALAAILKSNRRNVLLVGESGVGKTTLLASAVRQYGREATGKGSDGETSVPVEKRFWLTSGARLIAGMKYLGQWEQRCESIVSELADLGGVLCIENLLELVGAGGGEPTSNVASFLIPYLQRGEVSLIAECTPAELDACRRLLPSLIDVFQIVTVNPLDRRRAVSLLNHLIHQLKQQLRLDADRDLAAYTERLFRRFLPYQTFPGSTLSFLTDLFSATARRAGLNPASTEIDLPAMTPTPAPRSTPVVGTSDLLKLFVARTGLPELLLCDELTLDHRAVLQRFTERVIGQPAACQVATDLVTTFKAGLNDPARPLGSLLFCGPTGVGKTEMAKAIADEFFGHGEVRDRLVRLDMSEYSGYDAAHRLVSRPDWEPSRLIESLRRQPLSVVLFDEIEKASPAVFDILLGLLDEGRLTDRFGRVTSFRSAVVIMTSNLGADRQQSIGFGEQQEVGYEREVREFFRPEFFNRLSGIVTFHPLDRETAARITRRELNLLNAREGLVRRSLRLTWTDPILNAIAAQGFDSRYGARPLQRTVERMVAAPLATWIVSNPLPPGSIIEVDWDQDHVVFRRTGNP